MPPGALCAVERNHAAFSVGGEIDPAVGGNRDSRERPQRSRQQPRYPRQHFWHDARRRTNPEIGCNGLALLRPERERDQFVRTGVDHVQGVAADSQSLRFFEAANYLCRRAARVQLHDAALIRFRNVTRAVGRDCDSGWASKSARLHLDFAGRDFEHAALAALGDEDMAVRTDRDAVDFVQAGREHVHRMRHRMIAGDVAGGGGHDDRSVRAARDTANEAGELAVEEHTHTTRRAVSRHGRHADPVCGVNRSVVSDRETHRAKESRSDEAALATVGHDFGDAAVGEVREEEAVVRGQREVVDPGPHLRVNAFLAALHVEAQDFAALALGREQEALAVEFNRGGHGEVAGEFLRCSTLGGDPPDFIRANRWEIQLAVGADRERIRQRQFIRELTRRASIGEQFEQASVMTAFVHEQTIMPSRDAVGAGNVVGDNTNVAIGRTRAYTLAHHFGQIQGTAGVEREIIGTNDRSTDSAYRRDLPARDVDGTDLAAEGLRNVEAAVGADAHPVGAEQRTWRGDAAGGPSLAGANGRFGAEAVRLSCHNATILPRRIQLRRASVLRCKPARTFCYLCISGPPNAKRTKNRKRAATFWPAPRQTASRYLVALMSRLMRTLSRSSATSESAVGAGSDFLPCRQLDSRCTMTKSTGTRKIAKPLEKIMPVIVTVPIRRRATAPAPRAFNNGSRPKINANEVIRIGLRRWRAPLSAADTIDSPFSNSALANSTINIAFFAESPINMIKPICA